MEPSITEIEPHLFIGNVAASLDGETLREHHITAVVSLLDDGHTGPDASKERLVYSEHRLFVPCIDNATMDILEVLPDLCDFVESELTNSGPSPLRVISPDDHAPQDGSQHAGSQHSTTHEKQGTVLVHCQQGISRSAAVVTAYLMRKHSQGVDAALSQVRRHRKVDPNENFLDQLRVWQDVGYQIWEDQERKTPKRPYQAYLDGRARRLQGQNLTGDESIGIQNPLKNNLKVD